MIFQSLNIGLKNTFAKPSESNPYFAKLSVSYDNTTMQVQLSSEACQRIMELAGAEIAAAAQIQINDFIKTALAVGKAPMIEGKAL